MKWKLLAPLAVLVSLLLSACGQECTDQPAATGAAAAPEQKTYQWKLVTTWPKNFPGLGLAPENFARMVNEMSDGRLQIKVYGANELVPAMGVFDAVAGGARSPPAGRTC